MLSIAPDRKLNTDTASGGERAKDSRTAPRLLAADVPAIEGIRLSPYRAEAVLINISTLGILAECGMRLQPGTEVTVLFAGSFTPASVTGRVARTVIARIGTGGIRYHVGIAFTQPIPLPEAPASAEPMTTAAPAALAPSTDSETAQPVAESASAPPAAAEVTDSVESEAVGSMDASDPATIFNQW
jgi:hypothetical protein